MLYAQSQLKTLPDASQAVFSPFAQHYFDVYAPYCSSFQEKRKRQGPIRQAEKDPAEKSGSRLFWRIRSDRGSRRFCSPTMRKSYNF